MRLPPKTYVTSQESRPPPPPFSRRLCLKTKELMSPPPLSPPPPSPHLYDKTNELMPPPPLFPHLSSPTSVISLLDTASVTVWLWVLLHQHTSQTHTAGCDEPSVTSCEAVMSLCDERRASVREARWRDLVCLRRLLSPLCCFVQVTV